MPTFATPELLSEVGRIERNDVDAAVDLWRRWGPLPTDAAEAVLLVLDDESRNAYRRGVAALGKSKRRRRR